MKDLPPWFRPGIQPLAQQVAGELDCGFVAGQMEDAANQAWESVPARVAFALEA